jgi:DNA end-binding protein Ku
MATTIWKGRFAFGMVSIPVRLYKAARRERVKFHHVYRHPATTEPETTEPEEDDAPTPLPAPKATIQELPRPVPAASASPVESVARVRNMPVSDLTQAPVTKSAVMKGFEIEKDRFVAFEPRELAALRPKTSTELSIAEFVRLAEIDPIYFETSYYAIPDRGGEKPYALLFTALAQTNYAAIGSLAMHGREHATVIRPGRRGLILHTLFYENEVRADEEYQTDPALVNNRELELAKMLVGALAAPFDASKLKDTFEERLRALIHSRTETAVRTDDQNDVPKRAPVTDLMEILRKSLEVARKPPTSERADEEIPKKRRTRRARP